jgi:hypothetical protein
MPPCVRATRHGRSATPGCRVPVWRWRSRASPPRARCAAAPRPPPGRFRVRRGPHNLRRSPRRLRRGARRLSPFPRNGAPARPRLPRRPAPPVPARPQPLRATTTATTHSPLRAGCAPTHRAPTAPRAPAFARLRRIARELAPVRGRRAGRTDHAPARRSAGTDGSPAHDPALGLPPAGGAGTRDRRRDRGPVDLLSAPSRAPGRAPR